ncbi:hypothetical protein AAVH_14770 [Aphelenchoides avenae]|nr:hypothetical protein AAVH_14768 [Aphelenchus avenae]KAH7717783.1 hypothetical protein AAVH_14770 [Aphelenchus avenae]
MKCSDNCFTIADEREGKTDCGLYGDCIWWKAYWTVLDEANANDLPPDLSEDVKYYTDINFKIDYAIVHGKHFGDQDIPEEFVSCIQLE